MKVDVKIDKKYQNQFNSGVNISDIEDYASKYNNVIKRPMSIKSNKIITIYCK